MDIATVIVAAGSGSRFGGSLPKQFLMLEGKPVLCHSIDTFRGTFPEAPIVLVLSDEGRLWWDEFCRTTGYISPVVAPAVPHVPTLYSPASRHSRKPPTTPIPL